MSKLNLPAAQVRWEGADYQKGVGAQDCEIQSEWRTRQSSPRTSECDDDDLYPNFFIP